VNAAVALGAIVGTFYATACFFAGSLLLPGPRPSTPASLDGPLGIVVRFALGHLVFGSLWTLLALAGAFEAPVVATICIAVTLSGAAIAASSITDLRAIGNAVLRPRRASILVTTFAALILIRSLYPPTNDDALRGYLVTSRVVAETHRLAFQPFNTFVAWPLLAEMNTAATLLLGNETAATVFDAWVGLGLLAGVAALAEGAGLERNGVATALLAMVSSSSFLGLVGTCKVDVAGSLYGVLAACFALKKGPGLISGPWLSGLFLGAAVAVKYSNVFLISGLVWIIWSASGGIPIRSLMSMGSAAALSLGPQLVKNFSLTGNPVAPFLGDLFGTADLYWTAALAGDIGGPADLSMFHQLIWPLVLTFGGHTGMLGTVSPLLLGLVPFVMRFGFTDPRQRGLALAAAVIFGAWFLVYPWGLIFPRFHFTPIAFLAVVSGAMAQSALRLPGLRRVVQAAAALCLAVSLFDLRSAVYGLQYARGVLSRSEVYARHENAMHWYAVAVSLNRDVAASDRVFLEMPYSYFLRLDLLTGSQTAPERQRAAESCETRDVVIRTGGFRWLVQPTKEFGWLVAPSRACPIPAGFEIVSQTRVSTLSVRSD
jgi:hypothetical protein